MTPCSLPEFREGNASRDADLDGDGIALAPDDGLDDELELGGMDALGFAEPATNGDGRATADDGERHRDDWEVPVPLTGTKSLPAFPVVAYPPVLVDFVDGLATATQTPVDMAAVTVLGALAAAAGGRAVVEARPGWREPTNLYLAVAMAVGNRKTHVVRATTEPLFHGELDAIEKMRITVAEEKAQRQIADQRAVEAQRAAAHADDDQLDALTQAAIDAAVMAESITVSEMPRLLADDATPEALGTLMAEQDGRLAVISAEGGIFDAIAGRYSPIPYLDVYLKGHAGDHLRVDRKGRPPEIIDRPTLTICVAFQPGILPQISDRQGFRARGLLARFLYSVPHSYVGHRHVGAHPLDADLARRYEDHVKALVVSLAEWTDPQVLNFGLEADTKLLEFERALEPRLGPDGDLGPIADWASKLAGAVVRIAGVLHLATHVTDGYRTPIDGATFDDGSTHRRLLPRPRHRRLPDHGRRPCSSGRPGVDGLDHQDRQDVVLETRRAL